MVKMVWISGKKDAVGSTNESPNEGKEQKHWD